MNQLVGRAAGLPAREAVGAGQAVVDVDAIITDTERIQAIALRGEILLLCRYTRVSHKEFTLSKTAMSVSMGVAISPPNAAIDDAVEIEAVERAADTVL